MSRHIPRDFNVETALYLSYDEIINYCKTGMTAICDSPEFWVTKVADMIDRGETTAQELMIQSIQHNWKHYISTLLEKHADDLICSDFSTSFHGVSPKMHPMPVVIRN